MDAWVLERLRASLDKLKRYQCIPVQPRCIDAFIGRQKRGEFAQPFAELPAGAHWIAALHVNETDRDVNNCLKKETPGPALRPPFVFQNFMALKELMIVEQPDAKL